VIRPQPTWVDGDRRRHLTARWGSDRAATGQKVGASEAGPGSYLPDYNHSKLLTSGPSPFKQFPNEFQSFQILKFKTESFPCSINTQTLYDARFEYFEQLSKLGQLQIPNIIHVINFGTDSNLNIL
jgi:hypothetical protein